MNGQQKCTAGKRAGNASERGPPVRFWCEPAIKNYHKKKEEEEERINLVEQPEASFSISIKSIDNCLNCPLSAVNI